MENSRYSRIETETTSGTYEETVIFNVYVSKRGVKESLHSIYHSRISALRIRDEITSDGVTSVRIVRSKMVTIDGVNYKKTTIPVRSVSSTDIKIIDHKNEMLELRTKLENAGLSLSQIKLMLAKDEAIKSL